MRISVVDPVGRAIEHTKWVCFRPFDAGKWFTIGFCALLASFVEGWISMNFNFQVPSGGGPSGPPPGPRPGGPPPGGGVAAGPPPAGGTAGSDFQQFLTWVQNNRSIILLIALIVLAVVIALGVLLVWLGSRGQFIVH